jgi:hypothetical protein
MDSVSITLIVSVITVLGFVYTYVKDRFQQGRALGQLEQRVTTLENDKRVLETLAQTLTETRMAVTRLEQKVDTWIEAHH